MTDCHFPATFLANPTSRVAHPGGGIVSKSTSLLEGIGEYRDNTLYVNRAALQATETLEKQLALLQSAPVERDRFVSHLAQDRLGIAPAADLLAL